MRRPRIRAALACASIAISLGACAHSDEAPAVDPAAPGLRVTLPAPPDGVGPCLARAFPTIPDRALARGDIVRIVGEAKVLDRAKSACGARAVAWIAAVRADFAKP